MVRQYIPHGYHPIQIGDISAAKQKKLHKTGKLSLTAAELSGNTHTLWLHPENHKKARMAKNKGTGTNLSMTANEIAHNVMHGGSIFSSIADFFRNNGTKILDSVAAVGKVVAPELSPLIDAGRDVARTITGKGTKDALRAQRLANLAKARAAKQKKSAKGGSFAAAGY